jgi:hypothetical protein
MNRRQADYVLPARALLSPRQVPLAARPLFEAVQDGGDLKQAIGSSVRRLGFDRFAFERRRCASGRLRTSSVWGNFSERWIAVYRQRNFAAVDPRFHAAAQASVPVVWDRTCYPDFPPLRDFFDTHASLGGGSGVCMAIDRPNSRDIDFFAVTSSAEVVDHSRRQDIARAIPELWALGAYGHGLLFGPFFAPAR